MEESAAATIVKPSLNDDWKFIRFLNWAGVLLAAAPPFDFQKQNFENLRIYQYYASILIALTIFGSVYSFVGRHFSVYPHMNLTTITMDVLSLTAWTIFIISVIISSVLSAKSIEKLLGSLVKNDMFLHPKENQEMNRRGLKFRIKTSLLHFGFAALVIYDSYVWFNVFGAQSLNYYFFKNFQCYIPIFFTVHCCEILKFIKIRFEFSTQVLIDLVDKIHKFPPENEANVDDEETTRKWIRVSQRIKPRQEDVMQLKLLSKIFDVLFDSVELFNEIFSWQIMFLILATVMEVFQTYNFLIVFGSQAVGDTRFANVYFIILRSLWMILFASLFILVLRHATDLKCETERLALKIYKRLLEMPSDELLRDEAQEALIILNHQFINRPLNVNAVFFYLNYEFVANAFLTVTSFTPVIIQFNRI